MQLAPRDEGIRENLAAVQHEIWAHWMRYMFTQGHFFQTLTGENVDKVVETWGMPADKVIRWQRQMNTLYSDLTETEKDSDREQADKILAVLYSSQMPQPNWEQWAHWENEEHGYYGPDCFIMSPWGDAVYYFCEKEISSWIFGIPADPGELYEVCIENKEIDVSDYLGVDWRETLQRRPSDNEQKVSR